MIRIELPIKTVNTTNSREHWSTVHRRTKATRQIVGLKLNTVQRPALPVRVVLTRQSKNLMDAHDNLRTSLKPVVDEVAKWLRLDDADPRVTWEYIQERARTFGVRIEVTPVEVAP